MVVVVVVAIADRRALIHFEQYSANIKRDHTDATRPIYEYDCRKTRKDFGGARSSVSFFFFSLFFPARNITLFFFFLLYYFQTFFYAILCFAVANLLFVNIRDAGERSGIRIQRVVRVCFIRDQRCCSDTAKVWVCGLLTLNLI